ncbi:MAG TPA: glycosyltransferase family 9 protein [Candidatus Binataceae bacterium]|nr:glycosyltransferase family 9 protein [Candidatus Binataceae bacterium]
MSAVEAIAIPAVPPSKRVLIVLLGAIGDVVRALPLLGRIRRAWPDAWIAWAVEPKSAPVLEDHPWLDELVVYDRAGAPWTFFSFLARIRAGRFDLALDLQRHLKSGVTSLASAAPVRIGFDRSNTKEFNHRFSNRQIVPQPNMRLKLQQYQAFGDALEIPPAAIEFGLIATGKERERARAMLGEVPRPLLGVILGSSWPSRVYFPDRIAAVIRNLAQPDSAEPPLYPVLLGGPEEQKVAKAVLHELGETPALDLSGRTTLRDLMAIFPECAAAFGPDSGPMHIAAAVGCPVVSLWGATSPQRSAPWGYAEYAITGEIPCHPCYLRRCPIGRECMRRIAPDDVTAAVRRAIGPRGAAV